MKCAALLALAFAAVLHAQGPAEIRPEVAATIVVFNTSDPESIALADFYAQQRGIPRDHLVGLPCPLKEEITREEYDALIAEPLRAVFRERNWWDLRPADHPLGRVEKNRVRFIALIRGMPLKIAPTANYPGDRLVGPPQVAAHNEASVDSELAVLGAFAHVISGAQNNPYFRSFSRITDTPMPELMLVARLDAPTVEMVQRMIVDALAAEREGLRGFGYIDARNTQDAGLVEGDKWLLAAAADLRKRGVPVVLDNGEGLFPEGYPMRNTAFYFGWYAGEVAGPFVRPDFRFARGAIAVHIHSFSASTMRDAHRNWSAPLLAAGAAATLGNVYEPFLGLTPQIDIFENRLESGFTLAESAWMAERVTSWQTTVIGDPLYAPFRQGADPLPSKRGTGEWDQYKAGAQLWFQQDRASGEASLRVSGKRLKSGLIWEGLGLLELTMSDGQERALTAFREARRAYSQEDDLLRAVIHEIILLRGTNRIPEAQKLSNEMIAAHPKSRALEVLRQLDPPPPPPPAPVVEKPR